MVDNTVTDQTHARDPAHLQFVVEEAKSLTAKLTDAVATGKHKLAGLLTKLLAILGMELEQIPENTIVHHRHHRNDRKTNKIKRKSGGKAEGALSENQISLLKLVLLEKLPFVEALHRLCPKEELKEAKGGGIPLGRSKIYAKWRGRLVWAWAKLRRMLETGVIPSQNQEFCEKLKKAYPNLNPQQISELIYPRNAKKGKGRQTVLKVDINPPPGPAKTPVGDDGEPTAPVTAPVTAPAAAPLDAGQANPPATELNTSARIIKNTVSDLQRPGTIQIRTGLPLSDNNRRGDNNGNGEDNDGKDKGFILRKTDEIGAGHYAAHTESKNIELITRLRKDSGDVEARNSLVFGNIRLVEEIIKQTAQRRCEPATKEMAKAGLGALLETISTFNVKLAGNHGFCHTCRDVIGRKITEEIEGTGARLHQSFISAAENLLAKHPELLARFGVRTEAVK